VYINKKLSYLRDTRTYLYIYVTFGPNVT